MTRDIVVEVYPCDGMQVTFVVHRPTQTVLASHLSPAEARRLRQGLTDHPDIAAAVLALHGEVPALSDDRPGTTGEEMRA